MSDPLPGIIAQMRRLYHHMLQGAHITPNDLSRQIAALEALQVGVARLCPMPTTCGAEFCLPGCDTDAAAAAFNTVGELMADLHDEAELLADYDRASVSGRLAGHPIAETTPAMPQYKRDGWDRECVICACKWMEEADTECPQCAMKDKPPVQQTIPTPRPRATTDGAGGVSGGDA